MTPEVSLLPALPWMLFPWKLGSCHLFLQGFSSVYTAIRRLSVADFSAEAKRQETNTSEVEKILIGLALGWVA